MTTPIRYESASSQKFCAACKYWRGERGFSTAFVNGHPMFIEASAKGQCGVNFDKEWPAAGHCGKWQQWERL